MGNATSTATSGSPSPRVPFAGVVRFGKSRENLEVIEWACKRLRVSAEYELCLIHVTELNGTNPPLEARRYKHDELEGIFKDDYPDFEFGKLQNRIHKEYEHIWGIEYKGDNFQETLQDAVNKLQLEGLDTLVLQWSDDPRRMPVNRLDSKGCSVMLANLGSCTRNVLTLATGGADAGAGAGAGAAPAVVGAVPSVDDVAAAGVRVDRPSGDGPKETNSYGKSTGHLGRKTPTPRDDPESSNSSKTAKNKN